MIPLLRPAITKSDVEAVSKQLLSLQLAGGKIVNEFEEEFAKYVGTKYAVGVDTLTAGFIAVLQMLKPTWATLPSATYISMANALKQMGVEIQFHDGWVAGHEYEIATDKGLIVDSAHAIDREICKKVPRAIWLFSFHATKLLTTGKGGMICTNSKEQYNFLKTLVNNSRVYANNSFEYTVHIPGWNYYMSDIIAALGLSQLRNLDFVNRKRDTVKKWYDKYLVFNVRDNWSRYIYQVWVEDFNCFYDRACEEGIQCSKHFNPIHLQPAFYTKGKFPVAEEYSQHLISIPFYADMKEEDVKTVANLINTWRI